MHVAGWPAAPLLLPAHPEEGEAPPRCAAGGDQRQPQVLPGHRQRSARA